MSKKHYIKFAEYIDNCDHTIDAKICMANMVIKIAKEDNPRFDEKIFLNACGLDS